MTQPIRASLFMILSLILTACASSTQQASTEDGLSGVKSSMDQLYIRDGVQFNQYHSIYFEPLNVSYSDQKRNDSLSRRDEDFQFDDKEMAIFEDKFRTAFSQQWKEQLGWTVAEQPGPNVLRVKATISDLFLYASIKNDARSPNASLANETSKMQLQIELIDNQQQAQLRMIDQKYTGRPGSGPSQMTRVSSVSYWSDAQRMFRQTANNLSQFLKP